MLTLSQARSVTFAANDESFVSGGKDEVQVWRADTGQQTSKMTVEHVWCVAISKDGRIAAGTYEGDMFVWDAAYKQTTWRTLGAVIGLDFSPDSTRLVALGDRTATVWDIRTRERTVGPLQHEDRVWAAKYSPQGDRIATATQNAVRVYDSNNGSLLLNIPVQIVTSQCNTGLLWLNNDIFAVSDSKIRRIDASTGLQVSEWPVLGISAISCIAIPKHGQFIACSAKKTVTFWDPLRQTEVGQVDQPAESEDIYSIALSPDGRFLAIGDKNENISIKRLSRITVSILYPYLLMAHLNNSPSLLCFRDPTFRSTTLSSIRGSAVSSRSRKLH